MYTHPYICEREASTSPESGNRDSFHLQLPRARVRTQMHAAKTTVPNALFNVFKITSSHRREVNRDSSHNKASPSVSIYAAGIWSQELYKSSGNRRSCIQRIYRGNQAFNARLFTWPSQQCLLDTASRGNLPDLVPLMTTLPSPRLSFLTCQ